MEVIDLYDGKYIILLKNSSKEDKKFIFKTLRYDEEWRDLMGDGMILALCYQYLALEKQNEKFKDILLKAYQQIIVHNNEKAIEIIEDFCDKNL